MDSLKTLCVPIVQDECSGQSSSQSVEARIVTYFALNFSLGASEKTDAIATNALELLSKQPLKIRELGAHLAITSISALFDFGTPANSMLGLYSTAVEQALQGAQPEMSNVAVGLHDSPCSAAPSSSVLSSGRFLSSTFDLIVRRFHLLGPLKDCLPYVHIMLVWLHSLNAVQARLHLSPEILAPTLESLNWQGLARFLNCLIHEQPITPRMLECAREGKFIVPDCKNTTPRPLPEDDLIRGLVWGQFYFLPGWFDGLTEDDGHLIEDNCTHGARAERVLWLGLYLAFHTENLRYDMRKQVFEINESIPTHSRPFETSHAVPLEEGFLTATCSENGTPQKFEVAASGSESSEDGYAIIKKPRTTNPKLTSPAQPRSKQLTTMPKTCSWAARKGIHMKAGSDTFRVVGDDFGADSETDGREGLA
jgi:hypothetical protein